MKRADAYKSTARPTYQMPVYQPSIGLVGPERITGGVLAIEPSCLRVLLNDDCMGRWHYVTADQLIEMQAVKDNELTITVTTEKLRGRWQLTRIE